MAYSGPAIVSSAATEFNSVSSGNATLTVANANATVAVILTKSASSSRTFSLSASSGTWSEKVNAVNGVARRCLAGCITGVSAGTLTVSITVTGGTINFHVCLVEITANAAYDSAKGNAKEKSATLFPTAGDTGDSGDPDVASAGITTSPQALVIGGIAPAATVSSLTVPSGWTEITKALSGTTIYGVGYVASEAGLSNNHAIWTLGTARNGAGAVIAFVSGAGGTILPVFAMHYRKLNGA